MNQILQVEGLRFAYPGQPPLADGWSARIGAGVTLLHGDTGSGKSTLLRILAGVLPASGRLMLAGTRLDAAPDAYRRNVFFCDPATEQFDEMTVHACTAALRGDDPRFDDALWRALVEGFALAPHIDKKLYMLSTGSRRKVYLAAALASGRALTLLDEPAGALDAASIRCLWRTLGGFGAAEQPGRAIVVAGSEAIDAVPLAATIGLPPR
ncbi:ABC transporter ATP-binding protein [Variovorax sp. RT4R15]|uniref:ABC transporter ATP-binding protein n=1 Tax=Variovorax sp. RT4R15 TaxID=3443737 RepID=UPI003F47301D